MTCDEHPPRVLMKLLVFSPLCTACAPLNSPLTPETMLLLMWPSVGICPRVTGLWLADRTPVLWPSSLAWWELINHQVWSQLESPCILPKIWSIILVLEIPSNAPNTFADPNSRLLSSFRQNYPVSKMISSTQICNYKFDSQKKHMTSGSCTEKHIFLPFSHR